MDCNCEGYIGRVYRVISEAYPSTARSRIKSSFFSNHDAKKREASWRVGMPTSPSGVRLLRGSGESPPHERVSCTDIPVTGTGIKYAIRKFSQCCDSWPASLCPQCPINLPVWCACVCIVMPCSRTWQTPCDNTLSVKRNLSLLQADAH